jgi:hypothetical protein
MIINFAKTKQKKLSFTSLILINFLFSSFRKKELVREAILIGVTFSGSLLFEKHLYEITSCCSKGSESFTRRWNAYKQN